ncbi:MAG: hypothetical protein QOC93_2556 [Actinomycetota bacterium]|jgi:hypothetical protein|nr:hypothetical protein [Actinomycetota bacterium]
MIAPVLVPAMSSKSFSVQCPARRALDLAEDLDAEDTADASAVQRQELSRENLATVATSLRRGVCTALPEHSRAVAQISGVLSRELGAHRAGPRTARE